MLFSTRRSSRLVGLVALAVFLVGPQAVQAIDLTNKQWNMTQIHALSAQKVSTGSGVKIGIIDSGVNRNHPELAGRVVASATCVGTSGSASQCQSGAQHGDDIDGHGTHVAGIIAASVSDNDGVIGVAPGAQLVVARVFSKGSDGEPTATLDDVRAGIRWLLTQGVKVVNLSIGAEEQDLGVCQVLSNCQSPLKSAVEEVWTAGALPVIAAGNSQVYSTKGYGDLDAIVVGAVGPDDTVASYSTPIGNAKWGMVAPGGDPANNQDVDNMILSTFAGSTCTGDNANSCYAYLAGTSMAAPHVSAVAALLFARGVNRSAVVDTLLSTTDPVECGTNCAGRLDAARALGVTTTDNSVIAGGPSTTIGDGTTRTTGRRNTGTPASGAPNGSSTTARGPLGFDSGVVDGRRTPTTLRPQQAIVLNQTRNDGLPVGVLLLGFGCLAGASLMLSYSLRKTLTTLP